MGIWRHRSHKNFRTKNISPRLEELEMRVTPSLIAGLAQDFATGVQPVALAKGDFNGDGKLDLAVANNGDSSFGGNDPGGVSILLGNGDGTFQNPINYQVGVAPTAIVAGDLNHDGRLDLVVAQGDAISAFNGRC
ncbi:MAG TPA: VCBS repeat-containing protein [Gemmataceae bacterium]|nr:VCBS repeat-containing protein [Gemmataceae bacterium]